MLEIVLPITKRGWLAGGPFFYVVRSRVTLLAGMALIIMITRKGTVGGEECDDGWETPGKMYGEKCKQ
jgi:hypothetical protein